MPAQRRVELSDTAQAEPLQRNSRMVLVSVDLEDPTDVRRTDYHGFADLKSTREASYTNVKDFAKRTKRYCSGNYLLCMHPQTQVSSEAADRKISPVALWSRSPQDLKLCNG